MPVSITATVLSGEAPAPVQVVITGMTAADLYEVHGTYGDFRWPLPGGRGVATGDQVVLVDNRAPFNGEVAYTVTIDGTVTTSNAVELTANTYAILQSLNGTARARVEIVDPDDARNYTSSVTLFKVDGRADPVARIGVASTAAMELRVEADGTQAAALKALLEEHAVLVRRNDVDVADRGIPPVEILVVTARSDRLIGATGTLRIFTLSVQVIGDPEPDTALAAFDWDDFDTEYAGTSWNDFDTAWSASEWDAFDRVDYGA